MKKIRLLFIVFMSVNCFAQSNSVNTKSVFTHKTFIVSYSKTWTADTSKLMETDLILFAPLESDTDQFRVNINIVSNELSIKSFTLEDYKKMSDEQITAAGNDVELFESVVVKSDKSGYYQLVYGMKQGQLNLKITSNCYISNGKVYLVTFTTEMSNHEKYREEGSKILASFLLR